MKYIGKHYAAEDVATAREALLDRRSALLDKSQQRKILLQDSFNYHQFDRDCDETKGWINEKLKVATDDSYLDPTNLNGKVQKHQSFEVELDANKKRYVNFISRKKFFLFTCSFDFTIFSLFLIRVDDIVTTGQELIETGHIKADNVKAKVEEITQLWQDLVTASELKSVKLQEASQQQQFNRGVEDLELWLSEVEGQLNSEDCGKDITSVQNLQKKQALLEADVGSHQDRIEGVRIQADQFNQAGHFDAENILAKYANLG